MISASGNRRAMFAVPLAFLGLLVVTSRLLPAPAHSKPYLPERDDEVLETLAAPVSGPWPGATKPDLGTVPSNPDAALDAESAAARARAELQRYRESADPRFLGRAEAALGGFWDQPSPPVPILVLRARVRQSNHEFESALRDLDQALSISPADPQALLDRASVETVIGRYDAASRDCRTLEPLTEQLYSAMCRASLSALTGGARVAYEELTRVLASPRLTVENGCWVESLLGEIAGRLGQAGLAEQHYRHVLGACSADTYTRGALADLLLDLGRAAEVTSLLAGQTNQDALLLRLAIAERHTKAKSFQAHFEDLTQRFDEARLRGNRVHRREEARYELELRDAPEVALTLALANFAVQREPADVRIALEAALSAGHPERANEVVSFVRASHLEDPAIAKLLARLVK